MTLQGWILGGNSKEICWLKKGSKQRLRFDVAIPTPKGFLFAMYICHNTGELMGATADNAPSIPIQEAHDRLGYPGEDMSRMMAAKELG
jgi:hypothetical protein